MICKGSARAPDGLADLEADSYLIGGDRADADYAEVHWSVVPMSGEVG